MLLVWLAACQPLPHPFAGDAPQPGSSILTLRDMPSVAVAPLEGEPRATAVKLAAAMAKALRQREIAASARNAGLNSYELSGYIQAMPAEGGKAPLVALWLLRDPGGKLLGARAVRIEAKPGDWRDGNSGAVDRVAAAGAEVLAGLLEDKVPIEAKLGDRTRLFMAGVDGAPGDGGAALEKAIVPLLERHDLAIVTDPGAAADLVLAADVTVGPPRAGRQHVKIVWQVRKKGGGEIGTVAQENDVPAGLLDGPWGDVAYAVAQAAQDGIMALVDRGAPAPDAAAASGRS